MRLRCSNLPLLKRCSSTRVRVTVFPNALMPERRECSPVWNQLQLMPRPWHRELRESAKPLAANSLKARPHGHDGSAAWRGTRSTMPCPLYLLLGTSKTFPEFLNLIAGRTFFWLRWLYSATWPLVRRIVCRSPRVGNWKPSHPGSFCREKSRQVIYL
jgi:hypothetical protein